MSQRQPGSRTAEPALWHVSAVPGGVIGRDAIAVSLDVVGRELAPLVTTFFTVRGDGELESCVVHGSHLPPAALVREVRYWKRRLRGIDPLAPARIARVPRRVATLDDVAADRGAAVGLGWAQRAYEEIGVMNDVRLPLRDGERVVAGITLWRPARGGGWTAEQLARLEALGPLIEMAYLASVRADATLDAMLPETLTARQRQVARLLVSGASNAEIARALYMSPDTAKSHTRATLAKLGVGSRRELVMRFPRVPAEGVAGAAPGRARGRRTRSRVRVDGDRPPRALLAAVLEWAAERVGALAGGCALLSPRLQVSSEAWGRARTGAQDDAPRTAWNVHRELLPEAAQPELVRYLEDEPGHAPVLEVPDPVAREGRLPELLATTGLSAPVLTVLRKQGRIAALIWLAPGSGPGLERREILRALRTVHPLLELTHDRRLGTDRHRAATPVELAELGLTAREIAVTRMALAGTGNAAIANELGISESTVKKHMTSVFEKCGVRSRTQLIALLGDPR